MLHRGTGNTARWRISSGGSAYLPRRAVAGIYTGFVRQDALLAAIAPKVSALETVDAVGARSAEPELTADRGSAFDTGFTNPRTVQWALGLVTRHGVGLVGHERWHALSQAVCIRIAAESSEGATIEVDGTGACDAAAEALVGCGAETGEAMRAVDAGHARDTTIRAGAVLASKPGDAVVGIIATGFDTEAAVDRQLAVIGKASAVFVTLPPFSRSFLSMNRRS